MRVLKWLLGTVRAGGAGTYADLETMFGRTRVYDTSDAAGDTIRVLDVEGTWQSATYVDERWAGLAFEYHRRFDDVIFGRGATTCRLLMLGGGALSYPKHVVATHDAASIDVVEVDRDVTELARRYFLLNRLTPAQARRLRVTHADGNDFLARAAATGTSYDVIVNDAFAAVTPACPLADAPAAMLARAALAPDGLYVANVVSALVGGEAVALEAATAALADTFAHVWVIPLGADEPEVPDNNVVVATDADYSFADAVEASGSSRA